jgi:putative endonuclease
VTSDLIRRVWQHRQDLTAGFTRRYAVHHLVWYERHETMKSAISREKQIKSWKRLWKVQLVEEKNPEWRDLFDECLGRSGVDAAG